MIKESSSRRVRYAILQTIPRFENPFRQDGHERVKYDRDVTDPYNLNRFVMAQESVYSGVITELMEGRKTGHWIWFIFPQIAGLGHSPISQRYSLSSIQEARAYNAHPVLGPRLAECTNLVLAANDRSVEQIFGSLDALKFRSCMTLFSVADPDNEIFQKAVDRCFEGQPDTLTLKALISD